MADTRQKMSAYLIGSLAKFRARKAFRWESTEALKKLKGRRKRYFDQVAGMRAEDHGLMLAIFSPYIY